MVAMFKKHEPMLKDLGLPYAWTTLQLLLEALGTDGATHGEIQGYVSDLQKAVERETTGISCLVLDLRGRDLYAGVHGFSGTVCQRYAVAVDDMQEAAKCFALGRYTACVFHLMRVLEAGVHDLGRIAGNNDPGPSWHSVLKKINHVLTETKYPQRSPELQRHSRFLQDVLPHMQAIERAWRNKVTHYEEHMPTPTGEYTEPKAEAIFVATRALMDLLATELGKGPQPF
jgi:hypothetical protein